MKDSFHPILQTMKHDESGEITVSVISPGISKLEYAAIHILAGLSASGDISTVHSRIAVQQAKALFAELEKETA